jgi:hypothetical protein
MRRWRNGIKRGQPLPVDEGIHFVLQGVDNQAIPQLATFSLVITSKVIKAEDVTGKVFRILEEAVAAVGPVEGTILSLYHPFLLFHAIIPL